MFLLKNFRKLENYIFIRWYNFNQFNYEYIRTFLKYNFKLEKNKNKKLILKKNFLQYNFNISNKIWGFWINAYFKACKLKKNYNLLFYSIVFKIRPRISLVTAKRIDFFKSFLKIKRYFSRHARKNKITYYCTIKKKRIIRMWVYLICLESLYAATLLIN